MPGPPLSHQTLLAETRPASNHFDAPIEIPPQASLHRQVTPQKISWNLGYVPSRTLSALIILYTVLSIILCSINYPTISPDTWYISSKIRPLRETRLAGLGLCSYDLGLETLRGKGVAGRQS